MMKKQSRVKLFLALGPTSSQLSLATLHLSFSKTLREHKQHIKGWVTLIKLYFKTIFLAYVRIHIKVFG